jgi:hypothetical protein
LNLAKHEPAFRCEDDALEERSASTAREPTSAVVKSLLSKFDAFFFWKNRQQIVGLGGAFGLGVSAPTRVK